MEALCSASGNESTKDVVDSDVWPNEITLHYEDETGKRVEFSRSKNGISFNNTDGSEGLSRIPIESYGQGDASKTLEKGDADPKALMEFMDGFTDVDFLKEEDVNLCEQLRNNQSESTKLRIEIAAIPEVERQIKYLREKNKRLAKDNVSDLVKYQTALIREKSLRDELNTQLNALVKNYREILDDTSIFDQINNFSDEEIIVGKEQFSEVKKIVAEFSKIVTDKSSELNEDLNKKISALSEQLGLWAGKEKDIQKKIDEKKEELEKQGIPFDIGKINQIAKDLNHYERKLRKLEADKKQLFRLNDGRKEILKDRKEVKGKIYKERYSFGLSVNENLKNAVDGLFVSVKYQEGCFSPEFEQNIKQLMDWRKSQVSKAEFISNNISPLKFSEEVKKRRKNFFISLD